ncbi:dnaJ homolog subfamily B member 8-like isoform X2 [Dreissena polymorpha]|uniref:dnaJ homolog subfamily B member 8-like isoform X2 n=1 Tax=Dreissena polymorpha TaxID=45954 RepID=UPI00226403E2|nr:dnaJ homolog subfamily B member 8-like isoform X2 [Dreissena polymorpha]
MTVLTNLRPTICLACFARSANLILTRTATHYAVLGVSQNATQKQIREAYIELSKKHHPDQNKDKEQISHEKFQKINEAYSVLSKDVSRREYDRTLLNTAGTFHTRTRTHSSAPYNAASQQRYQDPRYQDPFNEESYNYRREWTGKEWEEYNRERQKQAYGQYGNRQEPFGKAVSRFLQSSGLALFWTVMTLILTLCFELPEDRPIENRNYVLNYGPSKDSDFASRNRLANTTDPILEKSLADYAKEQEELAAKAAAKASGKTV